MGTGWGFVLKFIAVILAVILLTAGGAFSGELDNYYLEQFGERPATSALLKTAGDAPARRCGMPLRRGLKRDWASLESSTRKTLAKYLGKPSLAGEATYTSNGGHFIIHYATSGEHLPIPVAPYTLSSWIQTVADTFETVHAKEVTNLGYAPPPVNPYHVYLEQLGNSGEFGYTQSEQLIGQSATSYIVVDNDFADWIFSPYNGTPGLQITAAHEFHHAIQFGYNYYFDVWYAEATATWMEDEVYDSVNQLYDYSESYLRNPSLSLDTPVSVSSGGGYGRWIFNRFLAENHGTGIIRSFWTRLGQTQAQNGYDIPMLPLIDSVLDTVTSSLSTESLQFAKRLYEQNWTSHTNEIPLIYQHPLVFNATYNTYPVNFTSVPQPAVTLPNHHALAFYRFLPSGIAPSDLHLSFSQKPATLSVVAIKKLSDGGFEEFSYDVGTSGITIPDFNDPTTAEAVLIIDNTSDLNGQTAQFSTDTVSITVTIAGSGSGTVNSDPSGINCGAGSSTGCSAFFQPGSIVNLFATPNSISLFNGWSGNCGGTGNCSVTLTANKSATATFSLASGVKVGTKEFSIIQTAYDDAATATGSVIRLLEGTLAGSFTAARDIAVKLEGGYTAAYDAVSTETAIQGSLKIREGTVRIKGVNVR